MYKNILDEETKLYIEDYDHLKFTDYNFQGIAWAIDNIHISDIYEYVNYSKFKFKIKNKLYKHRKEKKYEYVLFWRGVEFALDSLYNSTKYNNLSLIIQANLIKRVKEIYLCTTYQNELIYKDKQGLYLYREQRQRFEKYGWNDCINEMLENLKKTDVKMLCHRNI